ncbi:CHCH domain-containing protein [Lizonia empirigonia]|nr:CHCH domain-containing protein [Lizonia empirigonia]
MPRQRGGAAPVRPRPTHSTAAAPAAPAAAPAAPPAAATPQGPGLFGQMASTAAGVAVGSSIGHAVGGWFSGGSSAPADAAPQNTEFAQQHSVNASAQQQTGPCAENVNSFRKCMDENQGSLSICGWYLDQLKACQAAAGQY